MLPTVELMLHQRPPYYVMERSDPSGLVVEPVLLALGESGLPHFWTDVPPPRQLSIIRRSERPACGIGWFRTPERLTFAQFTRALYTDLPLVVLSRADDAQVRNHDSLAALIANPNLRLGVRNGYAYGEYIDGLMSRFQPRTLPTDRESAGMAALMLINLFDYMLLAREEIDNVRRALRTDFASLAALEFDDIPPGANRYLMCSQSVPEEWIDRLNRALPVETAGAGVDSR